MSGILYGTGTGPGDAELLTLKAVRTIRSCDMTVVPVSDSALEEPCIWEEGVPDRTSGSAGNPGKTGALPSDAYEKRQGNTETDP